VFSFFCINYLCTISEFESQSLRGVLDGALCDKLYQRIVAGRWFFLGTAVSSTNKTDRHDITEILLKVALNTKTPIPSFVP
jgi:hypothetical protein